jgi:ABC-type Fe3+-hydroxamate transport system substrate-binding protein
MKDQLNRPIYLKSVPKRIVSLVPSQTELLYDLGLESSIVGITKFCVHPIHFKKEKTIVGGTKDVHFDKIKALHPDIILCNKEENTLEMIQQLETIAPVHISDIVTIEDCLELIGMYGAIFYKESKATEISSEIQSKYENFKEFIMDKPSLKTAYFIWKKPWMIAAKATFIDEMMHLNKFDNYYKHLKRYPEVNLLANKKESAELVLLSSEPFPFKEKHKDVMKNYFPDAKILVVDGEAFSWYGSRLLKAFDYFKSLHQNHLNWNSSDLT